MRACKLAGSMQSHVKQVNGTIEVLCQFAAFLFRKAVLFQPVAQDH